MIGSSSIFGFFATSSSAFFTLGLTYISSSSTSSTIVCFTFFTLGFSPFFSIDTTSSSSSTCFSNSIFFSYSICFYYAFISSSTLRSNIDRMLFISSDNYYTSTYVFSITTLAVLVDCLPFSPLSKSCYLYNSFFSYDMIVRLVQPFL